MGFSFKDFKRAVIPREISDFTEEVEDFVRPVTDPIRSGIAKIVPKEIKPYASTIATMFLPPMAGPIRGFLQGAGYDALFQKMMTDPDDEDTDVDFLKSFMSGLAGSTRARAAKTPKIDPKTGEVKGLYYKDPTAMNVELVDGTYQPVEGLSTEIPELTRRDILLGRTTPGLSEQKLAEQAAANFKSNVFMPSEGNTFREALTYITQGTADFLQPYVDPMSGFDPNKPISSSLKGIGQTYAGAQAVGTPSQVRDAAAALEAAEAEYAAYLNQLDADQRASIEADRSARIAAYKKYMGLAGYTEEEINEALMNAGYITAGDTVYAARGGRIGFANGTDEMGIGNFVEAEKVRTEFMDKIQRMLQRKKMEMQMNDPGLMRFMNAAIPGGEGFYTKEEMAFPDMEKRYKQHIKKMEMDQAADDYKMMERTKNKLGGYLDMLDNRDMNMKKGGRINRAMGTRTTPEGDPISPDVPAGMQMDLRGGGFIPLGTEPRADDVPAMVGKDEFVLNDRAVAGIGKMMTGVADPRAGAKALYELQNQMEAIV